MNSKLISTLVLGCFVCVVSTSTKANCRDYQIDDSLPLQQLWDDISYLASDELQGRKSQSPGAELARLYIQSRFERIGLLTLPQHNRYQLPFTLPRLFGSTRGINLAGWVKGTHYPDAFLIVTAHYDHMGKSGSKIFNGADDNASGVAALLAIAEHIAEQPLRHSVIFLATDAEEQGLYGAKAFVQNAPVMLASIKMNLNLDMLAQQGRRARLYITASHTDGVIGHIVEEAQQQAGLCLVSGHRSSQRGFAGGRRTNWRNASDHAAFYAVGIPYLFIGVADHAYYHTEHDTVANIDAKFFSAAAQTSLKTLLLMDKYVNRK